MTAGDDPDDIRARGEFLDALSFVRALYDDPLPADAPTFVWSEGKALALGFLVIDALKSAAIANGRSGEAEVEDYVSGELDRMITEVMGRLAGG
ncbi:MAG: hypothetical protein ACRDN0_05470 [Trebonia sp.]